MKKQLYLLFIVFYASSYAQIPNYFEFLDHRKQFSFPGAFGHYQDEILYVSDNSSWPMTTVSLVNTSNNIDDVFSSFLSSRSKKIIHSDSSFTIYLYELFDYDVWMPGFYVIDYNSGEIEVDSVLTFEQNNVDFNNVCFDAVRDSTGQYYSISWDKLLRINDGELVEEIDYEMGYYGSRLFKNTNSDIYLFRNNEIYHFTGNNFSLVKSFQDDILNIKTNGEQNILLFEGVVMIYDSQFETLLHEITIDLEIFSLDQLHIQDSLIQAIIPIDQTLKYIQYNLNGNEQILLNELIPDDQLRSFSYTNDNEILVCGFHRDSDISSNLFFRSVPVDTTVSYERSSLSIAEFNLHQIRRDTFHSFTNINGDTIYEIRFFYDIDITLKNETNKIVKYFNIFSNLSSPSPWGGGSFSYTSSDIIAPDETLFINSGYTKYFGPTSGFEIVIPGANYRFNDNDNRIGFPEFTSSNFEETTDIDILLYPNPTVDKLFIKSPLSVKSIAIYDQSGHLVFYKQGEDIKSTDLKDLFPSTYFIRIGFQNSNHVTWRRIGKF